MRLSKLMQKGSTLFVFFLGALFLSITSALAVADLNISVMDGTQTLGGSTISLTAPNGTVTERTDQDGDGKIAVVLGDPGTYRLTITTPDGSSRSTTFDAPRNGSVTVDYDRSAAQPPRVSVNDTTSPRRSANGDGGPFSFSLLGSYGQSKWDTRLFDGSNFINGNEENLIKWGVGPELRYDMPNIPLFLATRFFYHPRGRFDQPVNISSYLFEARERWKWQMLAGWYLFDNNGVMFSLMAGITLAKIQLRVQGNSNLFEDSEIQVAPTVGGQVEVPFTLGNARRMYWAFGFTLAFMNAFEIQQVVNLQNEQFRIDSDLQWDLFTGIRVPF